MNKAFDHSRFDLRSASARNGLCLVSLTNWWRSNWWRLDSPAAPISSSLRLDS